MSEKGRKMTFFEKIENFWYYHKWLVVIIVVLILGLYTAWSYIKDNTKEEVYDVEIVSLFAHPLTPEEYNLDIRLSESIDDIDGNGQKEAVLKDYYVPDENPTDDSQISKEQFESHLRYCEGDVLLFDKPCLDRYIKKDIFDSIDKYVDLSQIPQEDIVYKDNVAIAVKLSESKILQDMKFIIDEVYVSVMFTPEDASDKIINSRKNATPVIQKLLEKQNIE